MRDDATTGRGRTAEVVELITMSDNLITESEKLLTSPDMSSAETAETLRKARREYQGYVDYFVCPS